MSSVSVLIPVYNSEDTIASCIASILNQSLTDLELIIVNDGSTDNSGRICDTYAKKDSRVRVIHQENKGRTEARHIGVRQANSEWVAFVDSDDTLPYSALSDLYEQTDDSTDIVLGNGYSLSPESRQVIPMNEFRHLAVRGEGTIGVPWGSLYRRTLLTSYLFDLPRHIINGEDYLFWLRLVFSTDKPVKVVYQSVYIKGAEHTSNSFHWTADYCYELNELRKQSIPSDQYQRYLADMIDDRLTNMFAVAVCCRKSEWKNSHYYKDIIRDIQSVGIRMPLKRRLFLMLPSIKLRKLYSLVSQAITR